MHTTITRKIMSTERKCTIKNQKQFKMFVTDSKADLFTFTESWLREGDDAVRAELCPDGYKFMGQNRI